MSGEKMTRRDFIVRSSAGAAGLALGPLAFMDSKVFGANERVRIGIVGPGARGSSLMDECMRYCKDLNMELVASCDIWNKRREEGAVKIKELYKKYFGEEWKGPEPIQCRNLEEICARKDIDALIIATADFQHAQHCAYAVRAGKDVYVEKPLANDLNDAKDVLKAVKGSGRIVQMGTQRRSDGSIPAVREFIASGVLGKISYVEGSWNYFGARWRMGDVSKEIKEEDTDWKRFLLNRPYVPFNPHYYREFRLYWPYSSGIPCQWLSHSIDAIQGMLGEPFPKSVVAHGGIYVWKDGRTNADTFQALLEYPSGCLVSYSTRFGNESSLGGGPVFYGTCGRLDAGAMKASGEGGGGAVTIELDAKGHATADRIKIDKSRKIQEEISIPRKPATSHMRNWMECIRTRQNPNADIDAGYSHSIAVIMAIRALHTGRRQVYDPQKQEIREG